MKILVPFKATNPKSRLGDILSPMERKELAMNMLYDVVEAIKNAGFIPEILSTEKIGVENEIVDPRDLNSAINERIKMFSPLMVVMSDLAILRPDDLKKMVEIDAEVVISPGRKGGTNIILIRNGDFSVSYHGLSFIKHLEIARSRGISCSVYNSFYTYVDVDDESDLLEILIHGKGRSRDFLEKCGFRVEIEDKEPVLVRKKR